jgi:hypothetical protein
MICIFLNLHFWLKNLYMFLIPVPRVSSSGRFYVISGVIGSNCAFDLYVCLFDHCLYFYLSLQYLSPSQGILLRTSTPYR